ncbi:Nif3-like dinuclear metal center hexameric protein [Streptococcus cuniculipharyngis]|uniref:GTP cyclohydrolase 1 type 2 homolog n=1 Tax=Streptococcus cuniculipharyngis TaxID=1562651 RepID=A0A5C5SBT0_9STRE|nr:Nif3-like dinuclear metal center hexameric protein [Streptococcus cuniculipharyngis]TWS98014.1 Nif3-like dinuclear metal center hexameric protein [Streptococcus cuniculipharyngis]
MKASQVIARYEAFCPPELSLEGDTCGLQLGRLDKDVSKLMIALDLREQTVAQAIAEGAELIIVKHAPIFRPLKDLVASPANQLLLDLVKHDIAVYVSHTNIDVVQGGLNDWFCQLLGIEDSQPLSVTKGSEGIGRIGQITPQPLDQFAQRVKEVFGLSSLRLVAYDKEVNPTISRVAICGGSGQSFYKEALAKGADLYITGDIYYHTAQEMLTDGLLALDPGHHIEVLFVDKLAELFTRWQKEEGWDLTVIPASQSTNPFQDL